jgi:copper transport protein
MRLAPRLALALALIAAVPATALALSGVRSTTPAPGAALGRAPASVRVALEAPLERAFLRLMVRGPRGTPASGPVRRDPVDPDALVAPVRGTLRGAYLVSWRAFTQDGHVMGGVFRFGVGRPVPVAHAEARGQRTDRGPLMIMARLLALIGPIGLGGLAVLRFGVVVPAWRSAGPRRPGAPAAEEVRLRTAPALEAVMPRWWHALWAFAIVDALGLAALVVGTLRALDDWPDGLGTLLADTRWGHAWLAQAAALVLACAVAAALRTRPAGRAADPALAWGVALAVPPMAAAVAISWAGHASSGTDRRIGIAIDALHMVATATWLGALAGLLALLPGALRLLDDEDRLRLGAGVVVRFSALAIGSVAALAVTGTYRALAELSSLGDLVNTGYGRALLIKLALFAALLAGGAYNRLVLHPQLERAALGLGPDDGGASERLRLSVAAELTLGAALLACVGVMTSLPPPG